MPTRLCVGAASWHMVIGLQMLDLGFSLLLCSNGCGTRALALLWLCYLSAYLWLLSIYLLCVSLSQAQVSYQTLEQQDRNILDFSRDHQIRTRNDAHTSTPFQLNTRNIRAYHAR
jgi:hypothetical protein